MEKLLKEKKKDKYANTIKMMEEEYRSSLLWYKTHRKSLLKEIHYKRKNDIIELVDDQIIKILNIFKQLKEEKLGEYKVKIKNEENITSEIKHKDHEKEKILKKIKKQQDKQKRKLGKFKLSHY